MKKAVFFVLALCLFMGGRQAYADNLKIGVVDLVKALNESESGKKAKGELESMIKAKQAVLDEKGKEIEKLKADFEKQASVLSADAKKSREEELERKIRDYQRVVSDSQGDVKKKESEYTGAILKELKAIIDKMGQDEGYTLIVEKAETLILYSTKALDLTDTVIKKYNELKAKEKK